MFGLNLNNWSSHVSHLVGIKEACLTYIYRCIYYYYIPCHHVRRQSLCMSVSHDFASSCDMLAVKVAALLSSEIWSKMLRAEIWLPSLLRSGDISRRWHANLPTIFPAVSRLVCSSSSSRVSSICLSKALIVNGTVRTTPECFKACMCAANSSFGMSFILPLASAWQCWIRVIRSSRACASLTPFFLNVARSDCAWAMMCLSNIMLEGSKQLGKFERSWSIHLEDWWVLQAHKSIDPISAQTQLLSYYLLVSSLERNILPL